MFTFSLLVSQHFPIRKLTLSSYYLYLKAYLIKLQMKGCMWLYFWACLHNVTKKNSSFFFTFLLYCLEMKMFEQILNDLPLAGVHFFLARASYITSHVVIGKRSFKIVTLGCRNWHFASINLECPVYLQIPFLCGLL